MQKILVFGFVLGSYCSGAYAHNTPDPVVYLVNCSSDSKTLSFKGTFGASTFIQDLNISGKTIEKRSAATDFRFSMRFLLSGTFVSNDPIYIVIFTLDFYQEQGNPNQHKARLYESMLEMENGKLRAARWPSVTDYDCTAVEQK